MCDGYDDPDYYRDSAEEPAPPRPWPKGFSVKTLEQEMKDFAQDQKEKLITDLEQSVKDLEMQLTYMRLEYGDRLYVLKDLNGRYLAENVLTALATARAALLHAHTN